MRTNSDTAKPAAPEPTDMTRWPADPLVPLGVLVGLFLIAVGVGTLVTAPWQYYGSQAVTILRIIGTIGTILIGIALIYVVWVHDWLAARRSAT